MPDAIGGARAARDRISPRTAEDCEPLHARWILLGLTLAILADGASSEVRLPRLIGDNMVLQRDVPLTLWGWADPGERIEIRFRGRTVRARTAPDGRWAIGWPAQRAGGPDAMTVTGSNRIMLSNVLVGDVWLASGQSNMQFPLLGEGGFGGVEFSEREIAGASFPGIRLFMVGRETALTPRADVASDGWRAVTPQSVGSFSAVAYLFGRRLHQELGVPIGLIESAWGGTPIETWIGEHGLRRFGEFSPAIALEGEITDGTIAAYDSYLVQRNRWYQQHAHEDRGRDGALAPWASRTLDDRGWASAIEPQPSPIKVAKDFDGAVWFRRHLDLPPSSAGQDLRLHLSKLLQADATYFNGELVGETRGDSVARDYLVPGRAVASGDNVIAVRLEGEYASGDGYVGMLGEADEMYAETNAGKLPLAGSWLYATGPDISELPLPPMLTEFRQRFPQAPTVVYNGIIAPLTRYRIRGVIWYQGESNVGRATQYRDLFPALIEAWRYAWSDELPFFFVQLPGYGAVTAEPAESPRAELREAQAAALRLLRTAMATAIDLGSDTENHPKNKQEVARRLALVAERRVYGRDVIDTGPEFRSMRIAGDRILVSFAGAESGLVVTGDGAELRGFAIAGTDGRYAWARAEVEGNSVSLTSKAVPRPTRVRYDWGSTPDGNLCNAAGLPAVPFRTDAPGR